MAAVFLHMKRWLVLLVATATFLLGASVSLNIPYMLTFLAMGITVANTSDSKAKIVEELNHLSGLLAVLFFAAHGTELDVNAFLAAGTLGAIYIICRMAGKWIGVYAAARATKQPLEVRHWAGSCLFAQAGAAIALSTIAVSRDPELGKPIQDIILGSVVLFEIIGPLFIRHSLLQAGEVPLAQAIHHTTRTPLEQVRALVDRFRTALRGTAQTGETRSKVSVRDLVRKAKGIHQSADFDAVIAHIEHSHDNTYPVVDDQMTVVGVIRYPLLSDVMFDHSAVATGPRRRLGDQFGRDPASRRTRFPGLRIVSSGHRRLHSRGHTRRSARVARRRTSQRRHARTDHTASQA